VDFLASTAIGNAKLELKLWVMKNGDEIMQLASERKLQAARSNAKA
jgi:hypothetical protein